MPKKLTPYHLFALMLLLAGAIWIVLTAAIPGTTTQGKIPAPRAGFLAPDFTLTTADGNTITLSELRGHPVIVNLWASWCGPCRAEMPALQRVHETYKDTGLLLLAVNATPQDSEAAALTFATELGLTFPILFDAAGEVSRLYELRALPSTYFIGPDGTIQEVVIGGPMAEALLRTRVEQLLALVDE
ncbi:MAG: redoxin domain-containing protein [Anaerolineales bacterium]|nr:redoxin domain-containing protein [Anaerolineales bacterium]